MGFTYTTSIAEAMREVGQQVDRTDPRAIERRSLSQVTDERGRRPRMGVNPSVML